MFCCCELFCKKNALKNTVKEALNALGKNNFSFIIHGNSFPASSSTDTGFGSPNSSEARKLIDFCSGIFNSMQLGPAGKTKHCDSSPYAATVFSLNPLFIDLEQLTTELWGKILSVETYKEIVKNNPNKNVNKTAYSYIYVAQKQALREAFDNFKKNPSKDFEMFKQENNFWLDKDALYEALSIEHENDYWPLWQSDVDKRLFNPYDEIEKKEFNVRISELHKKYEDEIKFYKFCQYVIAKQNEQTTKYALKKDIKMIADRQVAFSDRDIWAYQSLFLDGWLLGCPPDYFSNDGQAWGFPVLNPKKLFNEDGSLGEAGILMKKLYQKMFKENQGGIRIDHIVGLIDPWVYKKGFLPKIEQGAGRLYSSPEHPQLKEYAIATKDNLNQNVEADKEQRVINLTDDQISKYGALIEKIILEAAFEVGLDQTAIVCEDLGTLTNPVEAVMKKYNLLGMKLTQFVSPEIENHPYRAKNIVGNSWTMVGTHDNEPVSLWAKKQIETHEGYLNAKNLVEDLFPRCLGKERNDLIYRLNHDVKFLTQVKLAEIFASPSKNLQIFFTDFFGMKEVYNIPGTSGDKNWSLRIVSDFENFYQEQLKKNEAINLPLVLKIALEAQDEKFVKKHKTLIEKLNSLI